MFWRFEGHDSWAKIIHKKALFRGQVCEYPCGAFSWNQNDQVFPIMFNARLKSAKVLWVILWIQRYIVRLFFLMAEKIWFRVLSPHLRCDASRTEFPRSREGFLFLNSIVWVGCDMGRHILLWHSAFWPHYIVDRWKMWRNLTSGHRFPVALGIASQMW